MDFDRRVRVEQLYRSAMECDPGSRDAFVSDACQGDQELRIEVERLLSSSSSSKDSTMAIDPGSGVAPADSTDSGNRSVNQFDILEKIGQGGMGRVYRARDRHLGRIVALKFLAPELIGSEPAHARFLREAHALSAVSHPHIATIFDVADAAGEPFLVLEYLSGGTLRTKMRRLSAEGHRLSPGQIAGYAIQIAEGLAHAHRNGIVHRDVKTSNILLDAQGNLKITDFGLARLQGEAAITGTRHAMGTAEYMSPEQARGEEVDSRSDIFSFGVVLYEIATGELPFRSDHPQAVIHQILNAEPRPVHDLNPEIPQPLEQIIERALQKDRNARYQRLEDTLDDLAAFERGISSEAGGASFLPTATLKPVRRAMRMPRRRWLALAALVPALLFVPWVRTSLSGLFPHRAADKKHIAVIPFTVVGADLQNQAFCDGVVESLTSSLSQLEQFQGSLLVVPASEVRRQPNISVSDAQRNFGITLAVTGSIQRSGDQLRLTANLVNARSLRQLDSRSVDVPLQNLAGVEDRLLGLVAELLEIQIPPQQRSRVAAGKTSISEASDAYLQGRGFLSRWDKAGNLEQATAAFQRAIKIDSHYALAYTGLSDAYLRTFQRKKDPQFLQLAREAGERAVELNGRLAAAHVSLGAVLSATGESKNAVAELKKALDSDRLNVDAYRELGAVYESLNQPADAERTYRTAIDLRPGDWYANAMLASFYFRGSKYADAQEYFSRIVKFTPDNANGYLTLGVVDIILERHAEAEAALQHSIALKETDRAYSNLGTLYYQLGRYPQAVAMNEKAVELSKGTNWATLGNLADCYRRVPELSTKAPETYRRAIATAERLLAVNPKDSDVLKSVAFFRAVCGERDLALRNIEQARKLAPNSSTVGFKSVLVYEVLGRRKPALAALEKVLKDGLPIGQVEREPDLSELRKDPAYARMKAHYSGNTNSGTSHK
jgi:serine/threonine-protein kinase